LQGAALVDQALETKQSATSVEVAPETEALFTEALALLERARATHEQLGNVYELGLVTNNFGYTHYNKGEFARARGYFEQAAASMRGINEWRGELSPLSNLGALDIEGGHLAAAAKAFERILAILPEGKLPSYRGTALENLGVTQGTLGDLDEALRLFSSVLDIRHQLGERQGEGRALARIGATYYALGELDLATEFLQQALPIAIRSNDGRGQEAVLRSLGNIAYLQGDYETAIRRHRLALEVAASTADRTYLQQLIAKDLIALGRYDEAKDLAAQAQAGAVSTGSEPQLAAALRETGRALLFSGDAEGAVSSLKRAEEIFARLNLRGERAEVMHGLALATRELNRFDEAVLYGEASVAELEKLRLRVADPELRAFFSAARRDYYETQIDSLMKLHARSTGSSNYLHAALETSERSRARMIADLLQEASIDLRAGVDPSFQARQTELYAGLAEQRHQRDALLESRALSGNETSLQEVLGNLATIENDLNLLEIELRRSDPRLASMSAPAPLAVDAIQALIDDDTVLLQYALGAATSYVWIVTSDDVVAVELAGRVAIEGAARRVLESLRIYDPTQSVSDTELADLAELVLAPVAKHLQKRTIVVALDGALQYVPFSVLPVHGTNGSAVPLLADHNVVAIPSMSALVVPARESVRPATRTLAVFADPVVEATDPRFGAAGAISAVPPATSVALVTRSSTATLGRLPSTGYEAEAISALVPEAQRFVARGFSANREAVLSADLSRYQYLHFATHGLVDSRYPGLSALAFSQFDSHGTPQDGYLRLHDIYDLELRADLVVLSACETALGREVRGEGLIGLTQGFMYAGARSVVASLWQVPDRATAELMTRFYSFMLNDGMRPVEALRQAQLAIASERRWSNPYFWGGFVLLGDWR
jgi:CHAT domain-containing protein